MENHRNVSEYTVFLSDAPVYTKSETQHCVSSSACEAELFAAVECAQTMLFAKQILESIGL